MRNIVIFFLAMLFMLSGSFAEVRAQNASSADAADLIEHYMDKAFGLVEEADEPDTVFLISELQNMAREIFDFELMARMSLGRYWHDFDQEQKLEFVDLYTKLLEENYLGRLEEHMQEVKEYSREDVRVSGHELLSERRSEVRSSIKYQDQEIPVDYRLAIQDGSWQVYDVHVEGISLIQNYRSQFDGFLGRNQPQELLQMLQDKLQEEDPDLEDLDLGSKTGTIFYKQAG